MFATSFLKTITCLLLISFVFSGIPVPEGQSAYPIGHYVLDNIQPNEDESTYVGYLTYQGTETYYVNTTNPIIKKLKLTVNYKNPVQLQIKLEDAEHKRWELPEKAPFPHADPHQKIPRDDSSIVIEWKYDPFGFTIKRKLINEVIFDTTIDNLIFTDYYLEISTSIPTPNIYGFGERAYKFNLGNGTYSLWNVDFNQNIEDGTKGHGSYGSHPVYLMREKSKDWSMVLLRNVNAMSLECKDSKSLTYRVTGGILDFNFFIGDALEEQPEGVVEDYHEYLGGWAMQAFWAFGYHQSKWGYGDLASLKNVVSKFNYHDLPFDTIWSDIDYMENYKAFTVNQEKFPSEDFKKMLNINNKKWVPIIDCGISVDSEFYKKGNVQGVFLKKANGDNYIGEVWPGGTVWVDWFHPSAESYWNSGLDSLKQKIPYSGVWLDMNEISNLKTEDLSENTDIWNNLPYSPTGYPLHTDTIPLDITHYNGEKEFNTHNIFNLMESHITYNYLNNDTPLPFILTRSNVFGSGRYAAHWTGDISSSWEFLKLSIASVMNFNIYGMPMVGSDICGFKKNTTEELCARWMQVGSLYPFARNHAENDTINQEPWSLGPTVMETSRIALHLRYSLLKHYYTLFLEKFKSGYSKTNKVGTGTVFRPLIFEFPDDENLLKLDSPYIDNQFLLGTGLMVTPVVEQGATSRKVYFPEADWYNFFTGKRVITDSEEDDRVRTISAPLNSTVPMFLQAGHLVAIQDTLGVLATSDLDNVYELIGGLEVTLNGLLSKGNILGLKDFSDSNVVSKCLGNSCLVDTEIKVEVVGKVLNITMDFHKGDTFEEVKISGFKLYGLNANNNKFSSEFLALKRDFAGSQDFITVQAADGTLSVRFFTPRVLSFKSYEKSKLWVLEIPITNPKMITQ